MPKFARNGLTVSTMSGSLPSTTISSTGWTGRGRVRHVDHFDAQVGGALRQGRPEFFGTFVSSRRSGWHSGRNRRDGVWMVAGTMRADDPQGAALFDLGPVAQLVGRNDARPWLGQRRLGIAGLGLHRDQVVAVVAVEHPVVDHRVAGKPALDHVAIGVADLIHKDLGLHDEAIADVILVAQLLADAQPPSK